MASLDRSQDFDRLGGLLADFQTSWGTVFDITTTMQSSFYDVFWRFAPSVALIALMYYSIRMDGEKAFKVLLLSIFLAILMFPYRANVVGVWQPEEIRRNGVAATLIDTAQGVSKKQYRSKKRISGAFYAFDRLTTSALYYMMGIVNKSLGELGPTGHYAAPLGVLAAVNRTYTQGLPGSGYKTILDTYLDVCNQVPIQAEAKGDNLAPWHWASVGLMGGTGLGKQFRVNDVSPMQSGSPQALSRLATYPPEGIEGPYKDGFVIESRDYWVSKLRTDPKKETSTGGLLANTNSDLQFSETVDDNTIFYADNCAELYQIANIAQIERDEAIATIENRQISNYVHLGDSVHQQYSDRQREAQLGIARLMAFHAAQRRLGNEDPTWWEKIKERFFGGTTATVTNVYEEAAEIGFEVYGMMLPAVASLMLGAAAIIFPFVALLALLPGRESSLPLFFQTIVFIKMVLFFSYFFIVAGGTITLGIVETYAQQMLMGATAMTSHLGSFAAIGKIAVLLVAGGGSVLLSYVLVFNEKTGLRSLGFNKFGAKQMAAAGSALVAASSKALSFTYRGAASLAGSAQQTMSSGHNGRYGSSNSGYSGVDYRANIAPANRSQGSNGVTRDTITNRTRDE